MFEFLSFLYFIFIFHFFLLDFQADKETQLAMMSFYHKKQEELKKMQEDFDDSYLSSQWADTDKMKKQFQGVSGISWKPK